MRWMFKALSIVIDMPTVTRSLPAMVEEGACSGGFSSGDFWSAGLVTTGFGSAGLAGAASAPSDACTSAPMHAVAMIALANWRSVDTYLAPPLSNLVSDL